MKRYICRMKHSSKRHYRLSSLCWCSGRVAENRVSFTVLSVLAMFGKILKNKKRKEFSDHFPSVCCPDPRRESTEGGSSAAMELCSLVLTAWLVRFHTVLWHRPPG